MNEEIIDFQKKFWKEYLFYEKEFINITDFIQLDKRNFHTYSFKLLEILVGVCSSLDKLFRKCAKLEGQDTNIGIYKQKIIEMYPNIINCKVNVLYQKEIELYPFKNWQNNEPLAFWEAYTNIKHDKAGGIINATYENVILSLSAQYLLNIKYMDFIYERNKDIFTNTPIKTSDLFYIDNHEEKIRQNLMDKNIIDRSTNEETIIIEKQM